MIFTQIEQMLTQYGVRFLTEYNNSYCCFLSPIQKETAQTKLTKPNPFCSVSDTEYCMVYSVTVTALAKGSKITIQQKDYLVTACDCYYFGERPIYQWASLRLLGESEGGI